MPGSAFSVDVTELPFEDWTTGGPDRVEFLFRPGTGEAARPLARIASGGEISRVMLALKGVLGEADSASILVFDEIDAGIGGATAVSVGRRLARLAESKQVLVVTHLPQVAAFATTHVVVQKVEESGRTLTKSRRVEGEERVSEIARMLSGAVTDTSVAHARELLDSTRAALSE
jgi:DNA repair protein RecN (Recombination protein N)